MARQGSAGQRFAPGPNDIERAATRFGPVHRPAQNLRGRRAYGNRLTVRNAIDPAEVAVRVVRAHQAMDVFDCGERRVGLAQPIARDLDISTQPWPTTPHPSGAQ